MSIRAVKAISQSQPTLEGAGVKLRRAFGSAHARSSIRSCCSTTSATITRTTISPASRGIRTAASRPSRTCWPAPWSTATASGNRGTLGAGDVQWMTAGSGILHQEMPKGDAQGRMHGFQLWANLPSSLKMTAPRYQDIRPRTFPRSSTTTARACASSAASSGASGPGRRHRRGSALPRYVRRRRAGARRCRSRRRATPSPTCSRIGHVPRRVRSARGADRARRRSVGTTAPAARARPAIARSCCSTAATR